MPNNQNDFLIARNRLNKMHLIISTDPPNYRVLSEPNYKGTHSRTCLDHKCLVHNIVRIVR